MNWLLVFLMAVCGIAFIWFFAAAFIVLFAYAAAIAAVAGIIYALLRKAG